MISGKPVIVKRKFSTQLSDKMTDRDNKINVNHPNYIRNGAVSGTDDGQQPLISNSNGNKENLIPLEKHRMNISESQQSLISDDSIEIEEAHAGYEDIKLKESLLSIAIQILIPFLIAGLGTVAAGLVLDIVQHFEVFVKVSEVFILVPALLGLKGNLEMTLASRLSTQANLGNMDQKKEKLKMIGGNLVLTQAQAIIVGFLASLFAMVMGWIPQGKFNISHGLLLCASSILTAALASFILGCMMVLVVLVSRRCNINPDNVATPIAASLGDITTLTLLAFITKFLFHAIEDHKWVAPVIISLFLGLTPVWFYLSATNKYTKEVIYSGWTPVIAAMIISSVGGLILDVTVSKYVGLAVFQPVINGVGGNLVAIHSSRMSTTLHMSSTLGELPHWATHGCPSPVKSFCSSSNNSRAARVLLGLVIPGQLIFMGIIFLLNAGHTPMSIEFILLYLTAAVFQVILLLYVADWLVHLLWRHKNDPDNSAIPYLTALGDLLGTGFLAVAFIILSYVKHTKSNR